MSYSYLRLNIRKCILAAPEQAMVVSYYIISMIYFIFLLLDALKGLNMDAFYDDVLWRYKITETL